MVGSRENELETRYDMQRRSVATSVTVSTFTHIIQYFLYDSIKSNSLITQTEYCNFKHF